MDQIKEAFVKVKSDMDSLREEVIFLKKGLSEIKNNLLELCEIMGNLNKKVENLPKNTPLTTPTHNPTDNLKNTAIPTHNPTHKPVFKPQEAQILPISTGNGGVPTDKQTNRQTDQQIQKEGEITLKTSPQPENSFKNVSEIIDSLDSLKKELRLKFKRLTDQEFLVFSTMYQLDEEEGYSDYRLLAKKLNLTESSIRDYVGRLIQKGIPLEKTKINNKTIQLSLSSDLKKIASLPTIMQLREM